MKSSIKWYIFIEVILGALVILVAFVMLREQEKDSLSRVSVILDDSDDSQWEAFRYGLEMAAQDAGVELVLVSTEGDLTLQEEEQIVGQEIDAGADALIVKPVWGDGAVQMLEKAGKKIPLMLTEAVAKPEDTELAATEPDQYALGEALAEELLKDYSGSLEGKSLGIVAESGSSYASGLRMAGFWNGVSRTGLELRWTMLGYARESGQEFLEAKPQVDFVVALDDASTRAAGQCAAGGRLQGALVYGIGNSTEAAYYLDTGAAECLVVPDSFQAGYQSLTETVRGMDSYLHQVESRQVSHTVIRRDTLFSRENQEILFTMSQ